MDIFTSFLKKSQISTAPPTQKNPTFIVKSKGREININLIEEKKVKYIKKSEAFDLNFQVHGKTIFQNLVLTAQASINSEIIPIKCIWKRVNNETVIIIKDINSFSYMPTAEDIGYIIEVEVKSLDNPGDTAIAQYGPIEMDKDMKNAIELLLTSGQTHFSCRLFDSVEQEKVPNKEFMLYLLNDEIKLVEIDYNRKETLLEKCRYSPSNPIVKLNPNDITRFTMKFMEYNVDNNDADDFSRKVKSEYNLVAMSKQCRELIYLIIQFFLIDERVKNNKIFSMINYNNLPPETKAGITDLITQLKTLNEENEIMLKNIKCLENCNRKLNNDLRNLEEDFQITLEQINGSNLHIEEDIEKNSQLKKANIQKNGINNNISDSEWKKKYDDINNAYKALKAQEKAFKEEKKEFLLNEEISKNLLEKNKNEIKDLKEKLEKADGDLKIFFNNYNTLNEQNTKIISENEKLTKENEELKNEIEKNKTSQDVINEIAKLKEEIEKKTKQNETLQYENKNLIIQRNLLNTQKSDLFQQFEKIKKEKEEIGNSLKLEKTEKEKLLKAQRENDSMLEDTMKNKDQLTKDYNDLKNTHDLLKIDFQNLQEKLDKLNENNLNLSMSTNNIKISPDEFEEYDQLRKEKDESDALIMQLRSNNEAKDLEIQNLRMIIDSMKAKS